MIFSKDSAAILGMNARNLLYISRYNSAASKKFADDKIFTKQFLESRGVGVAKLYQIVKNQRQLTHEFFAGLPESFVIKPNRGFAGGGILVIVGKKGKHWLTISGKKLDEEQMYLQCIDILEGKYSISGTHDDILVEEKLDPHPDFRLLTQTGLSDIRVIVFNMVPIMAMLRVPTIESEGKANMELGAIAMGIDLGSGITTGAAKKSKFIRKMPNGESAQGFKIPHWDEILYSCAKIQQVTKIGFLGVDLVVTRAGVAVLEVNARPGLKIQVANQVPMKRRLDKVVDLKVMTPEEGVDIAKTLFAEKSVYEASFIPKPILGITENVLLNTVPPRSLVAKIDLNSSMNQISAEYFDEKEKLLDITLEGKRLKLPIEKMKGNKVEADLILAGKYLTDFYIDANKKFEQKNLAETSTASVDERMLRNIDKKVCEIDSQIKLLSYINPRNINEQKALFLANSGFSPRFSYKELDLDFSHMRNDLKKIPVVNHALYPLYNAKIKELEYKLMMLEARGSSEYSDLSQKVFGTVTRHLYQEALKFIRLNEPNLAPDSSAELDTKRAVEILKDFLVEHNLGHWQIKILEDSVADIQVTKREAILVKKGAKFTSNRLKALLVHEIGTHVFRYENGKTQPLRILERGTANYLRTEEGLAVWNQNQLGLALGDKFLTPGYQIVALYMAQKMGFHDLFNYLKSTFDLSDELAWKLSLKSKRGYDNSEAKGAFTKDALYFMGMREVDRFIEKGGDIADLYVGKISVPDLPLVQKIDGLRPAKLLL
ncbi:DUF1704 domain-containing protein [bacterium]|nr:DUF1704 domain-containing protein [bacterium]NCQ55517.1 DUF1704 domain-containing protein [Candidatus Parcubacteria bacterium]NCS67528.1 DUF1704 domain-containing protein [Candidatus Peregrinibacteria bacterium]NCS96307.1 DUF1704 domain-containing protein [bacterium]